MLPEMRWLIESARHRAMTAANLAMVTLYWNIGRVITRDLQQNAKRGGYGERLLERLAAELAREYGSGYSISNLWDMRRFYVRLIPNSTASGCRIVEPGDSTATGCGIRTGKPSEKGGSHATNAV